MVRETSSVDVSIFDRTFSFCITFESHFQIEKGHTNRKKSSSTHYVDALRSTYIYDFIYDTQKAHNSQCVMDVCSCWTNHIEKFINCCMHQFHLRQFLLASFFLQWIWCSRWVYVVLQRAAVFHLVGGCVCFRVHRSLKSLWYLIKSMYFSLFPIELLFFLQTVNEHIWKTKSYQLH